MDEWLVKAHGHAVMGGIDIDNERSSKVRKAQCGRIGEGLLEEVESRVMSRTPFGQQR